MPMSIWDSNLDARFAQFKAVVAPDGVEIKGSRLSDAEMKHALALLNEADAKLFIGATAGVLFTDASLNVFKEQQAHYLGANITDQHKPKVRQQIADLQQRMRAMAPQEFLQLYVLTRLVERILRVTPNHFGFFAPDELGAFHWTVDSKNEGRSALENCWTMMGGGLLQSAFLSKPSMWIPGIDTSAFDKAFLEEDQSWPDYIPTEKRSQRGGQIMNLGKILRESFSFADSRTDASLQLADIATNAFRRVVRGNLPREFIPLVSKMLIGFEGPTIELHSTHDDTVNYPKLFLERAERPSALLSEIPRKSRSHSSTSDLVISPTCFSPKVCANTSRRLRRSRTERSRRFSASFSTTRRLTASFTVTLPAGEWRCFFARATAWARVMPLPSSSARAAIASSRCVGESEKCFCPSFFAPSCCSFAHASAVSMVLNCLNWRAPASRAGTVTR